MFCISCGSNLSDEASFCWKFGKAQSLSAAVVHSPASNVTVIRLACPSCGANVEVSKDMSRLNCQHCGREQFVVRSGGEIVLKPFTWEYKD